MLELRIGFRFKATILLAGLICAGLICNLAGAKNSDSGLIRSQTVPPAANQEIATNQNWWSIRPLVAPAAPKLSTWARPWARTPIDAFVAQKLDAIHLRPSPAADRTTLIRRLYFDLLG